MDNDPQVLPYATASRPRWYLNPYLHLALNGFLVTASEVLLKRGAIDTAQMRVPVLLQWLPITALASWWVWAGIACYIVSFFNWLHVLRWIPLSIAFPLAAIVHVLIPLGAWLFLGETVSPARWLGIVLILAGIWLVAKPLMQAEEALMTPRILIAILLAQVALVAGQIFLKHGMNLTQRKPAPRARVASHLVAGIAALTAWFFLWMGLLQERDLSYIYPFEGISPILLVIAAVLILRERLSWQSWLGVGLIAAGTLIVGVS